MQVSENAGALGLAKVQASHSKSRDIPAHPKKTALSLSAVFALIFLGTSPSTFCFAGNLEW